MATILSAPFENGLTGGLAWDSLTHGENLSIDTTQFRHGVSSMKVTGTAANSVFGSKTITTNIVVGSFYLRFPALPATNCLIVRGLHPTRTPGISLNPNGKLQSHLGASDAPTSPSTVLAVNTWYLVDYKFDTSTTTFTVDFMISDTNGSLLSTATQLAVTGQTAAAMTALVSGQTASVSLTSYQDDHRATNVAADYPLGPGTANDGTFPAITNFPASWLDDPTLVSGCMFGLMAQNTGSGDNGQAALSEGPTKANRSNLIHQTFYANVQTTGVLTFEKQIQNASLLGHQGWPMIHPFGFGSTTVNWPALGMAAFTNGSQDAYLDAWITVFNAQLGSTPFLIRPFREMTNNVTIYGRAGGSNGGVNETTASFIAGWRHVYTRIRNGCPMARFVWCPDTNTAPSDTIQWYPGDAYVDWIGVDAYGTSTNSYNPAPAFTAWYAAYKPSGGSLGLTKPIIACETSIQAADPNRIADFQAYTALFLTMTQFKAVCFWDSAPAGPYYVSDSPAGFLAAFQSVINNPPFTGSVVPVFTSEPVINMGIHTAQADGPALLNGVTQSGKVLDGMDVAAA